MSRSTMRMRMLMRAAAAAAAPELRDAPGLHLWHPPAVMLPTRHRVAI